MDGLLVERGEPYAVYSNTTDSRVAAFLGIGNTFGGKVVGRGERTQIDTPIFVGALAPIRTVLAALDGVAATLSLSANCCGRSVVRNCALASAANAPPLRINS